MAGNQVVLDAQDAEEIILVPSHSIPRSRLLFFLVQQHTDHSASQMLETSSSSPNPRPASFHLTLVRSIGPLSNSSHAFSFPSNMGMSDCPVDHHDGVTLRSRL